MIIVAYLSLFDGEIKQAAYYDCSPLEAMNSFLAVTLKLKKMYTITVQTVMRLFHI